MTNLDKRRVVRETNTLDTTRSGRRVLVVMLEVGGKLIRIKPKGTRKWYEIDLMSVYREAVRLRARQIREEKKAAKAARKAER